MYLYIYIYITRIFINVMVVYVRWLVGSFAALHWHYISYSVVWVNINMLNVYFFSWYWTHWRLNEVYTHSELSCTFVYAYMCMASIFLIAMSCSCFYIALCFGYMCSAAKSLRKMPCNIHLFVFYLHTRSQHRTIDRERERKKWENKRETHSHSTYSRK